MIRRFLILATSGLACLAAVEPARPNIIIINMDDMGYGDIQPFNSQCRARTPNISRMAAEGMRLTSFYAATVCSPSRAQLLTGSYAKRLGMEWVFFANSAAGLSERETTVGSLLQQQGYATMCVGKWHLGDQKQFLPIHRGFDHFFGLPYSNDMDGDWDGVSPPGPGRKGKPPLPLLRDDEVIETLNAKDQDLITGRYTDVAVDFISTHVGVRFFLYLAHSAVHVPIHPGPEFSGKSGKGRYIDWVEESDASVGRVLDSLRQFHLEQNTLVLFTSDNGPWLIQGADGGSAGVLRGGKCGTYEGGVRVPTIAWWPGRIAAGSSCGAITGNIDLMPTLVTLAGGTVPTKPMIDGQDISALLLGSVTEFPGRIWHYFSRNNLEAIRQGPWKYAFKPQLEREHYPALPPDPSFIPTLYNLDNDLSETTNVVAQHPEIVQRMQALIVAMDADLGVTGKGPGVRPIGMAQHHEPLLLKHQAK